MNRNDTHETFEEPHLSYIISVNSVDLIACSFISTGHDAVEDYGQKATLRDCFSEGIECCSLQLMLRRLRLLKR